MEQLPLWHRSRPPVDGQDYWHPKYSAVVRAVRGGRECRRLCSARVERPHGGVASSHRQHQLGALKRQLDTLDELQGGRAIATLRGDALSTTEEAQRSSARTQAERLYARLVDSKYDAIEREQRGPERCGNYTPTLDQPECARCRAGLPTRRARATADGDEGGRHQLIAATVSDGTLYTMKLQSGDKRWFKGQERDLKQTWSSFTVA